MYFAYISALDILTCAIMVMKVIFSSQINEPQPVISLVIYWTIVLKYKLFLFLLFLIDKKKP